MLETLQLDYLADEDRLVLKISEKGQGVAEPVQRCWWLTRRTVAAWLPDLRAMAEASAAVVPQLHPAARQVMTSAHHAAMAAQARTGSAPAPGRVEVADATLITRVVCGRHADGRWVLQFELGDKSKASLKVTSSVLHAFMALLERRLAQANWGLRLGVKSSV